VTRDTLDKILGLPVETIGDSQRAAFDALLGERHPDTLDDREYQYVSDIAVESGVAEPKVRDVLERARDGKITLPVEEANGKWRLE